MSLLFLPLELKVNFNSLYSIINLFIALGSFMFAFLSMKKNGAASARPAFVMGVLFHFIYQWPLALCSSTFENSLTHYWFFSFSIHTVAIICLLWVYITPQLNSSFTYNALSIDSENQNPMLFLITAYGFGLLCVLVYLYYIPFRCTAIYSLIYEPYTTLLAREVSGKISSTNIPFYINGALINVICPFLAYQSLITFYSQVVNKYILKSMFSILLFSFLFLILYFTGAKGNFIPTLLLLFIALIIKRNRFNFLSYCVVGFPILFFGLTLMITVEFLRERSVPVTNLYNLGYCAQKLGACDRTKELLFSLKNRNDSLGFDNRLLPHFQQQMEESCPITNKTEPAPVAQTEPAPVAQTEPVPVDEETRPPTRVDRFLSYFYGIFYRAVGVPIQVASWHFKYVEDFGSPGKFAVPFALKLFGKSESVSIKINKIYGSIYSSGAQVLTGTAPTSFLLAWPAYWGWIGLVSGILCVLIFDSIYAFLLRKLNGNDIQPIAIGFVYINCVNFLCSNFETTLFSHGGALSILLIYIFGKLSRIIQ